MFGCEEVTAFVPPDAVVAMGDEPRVAVADLVPDIDEAV